eukprot:g3389.t1
MLIPGETTTPDIAAGGRYTVNSNHTTSSHHGRTKTVEYYENKIENAKEQVSLLFANALAIFTDHFGPFDIEKFANEDSGNFERNHRKTSHSNSTTSSSSGSFSEGSISQDLSQASSDGASNGSSKGSSSNGASSAGSIGQGLSSYSLRLGGLGSFVGNARRRNRTNTGGGRHGTGNHKQWLNESIQNSIRKTLIESFRMMIGIGPVWNAKPITETNEKKIKTHDNTDVTIKTVSNTMMKSSTKKASATKARSHSATASSKKSYFSFGWGSTTTKETSVLSNNNNINEENNEKMKKKKKNRESSSDQLMEQDDEEFNQKERIRLRKLRREAQRREHLRLETLSNLAEEVLRNQREIFNQAITAAHRWTNQHVIPCVQRSPVFMRLLAQEDMFREKREKDSEFHRQQEKRKNKKIMMEENYSLSSHRHHHVSRPLFELHSYFRCVQLADILREAKVLKRRQTQRFKLEKDHIRKWQDAYIDLVGHSSMPLVIHANTVRSIWYSRIKEAHDDQLRGEKKRRTEEEWGEEASLGEEASIGEEEASVRSSSKSLGSGSVGTAHSTSSYQTNNHSPLKTHPLAKAATQPLVLYPWPMVQERQLLIVLRSILRPTLFAKETYAGTENNDDDYKDLLQNNNDEDKDVFFEKTGVFNVKTNNLLSGSNGMMISDPASLYASSSLYLSNEQIRAIHRTTRHALLAVLSAHEFTKFAQIGAFNDLLDNDYSGERPGEAFVAAGSASSSLGGGGGPTSIHSYSNNTSFSSSSFGGVNKTYPFSEQYNNKNEKVSNMNMEMNKACRKYYFGGSAPEAMVVIFWQHPYLRVKAAECINFLQVFIRTRWFAILLFEGLGILQSCGHCEVEDMVDNEEDEYYDKNLHVTENGDEGRKDKIGREEENVSRDEENASREKENEKENVDGDLTDANDNGIEELERRYRLASIGASSVASSQGLWVRDIPGERETNDYSSDEYSSSENEIVEKEIDAYSDTTGSSSKLLHNDDDGPSTRIPVERQRSDTDVSDLNLPDGDGETTAEF